jgi:uncharacterized protein with HEPN domain/predicted nucleotidyltransferase
MRREHAIRILREHEHDIRAKGVTRLALFGSTARDQARPDSDVDLLVDYDGEGRSALEFFCLEGFFSELLGAEAEVAKRDRLKRFLKDAILAEALEIFPNPACPPYYPNGAPVAKRSPRQALEDIRVEVAAIEGFIAGRSFEVYQSDGMLRRAIERSVEIISEASRKLPPELTDTHPKVAWKKIRGIGNILRHAYPDVDPATVWDIATVHIRPLKTAVAAMIAEVEKAGSST